MKLTPFIIITGLSGSGKGTFLRALEDHGYFCVDNLPVGLVTKFYELVCKTEGEAQRAAIVIDVREGAALSEFPAIYSELLSQEGPEVSLLFLEASDEVLMRRFSETRRPHPLDPKLPVRDAIAEERQRLVPIRAMADFVLDTSSFNIHELRKHATGLFGPPGKGHLLVSVVSFGFKHGVPIDSDLMFDVRFLPNPNFVPELKSLTGKDPAVKAYIDGQSESTEFKKRVYNLLDFLLPQYEKEGKSYLTIAIGCTGGHHRSVALANDITAYLDEAGYPVRTMHRDIEKG